MIQAFSMINVTVTRIRDFLILTELKGEVKEQPSNSSDAIVVENGKFKWGYEQIKMNNKLKYYFLFFLFFINKLFNLYDF
jgi:hypothetical protein